MLSTRTVLAVVRQEHAIGIFSPKTFEVLSTSWTTEQIVEDIDAQGYDLQAILSEHDSGVEQSFTDFLAHELADDA